MNTTLIKFFAVAILTSMAWPAFAESAPVYDADEMSRQFDASVNQAQEELPPPPPPLASNENYQDADNSNAFVPMQEAEASQPSMQMAAPQDATPQPVPEQPQQPAATQQQEPQQQQQFQQQAEATIQPFGMQPQPQPNQQHQFIPQPDQPEQEMAQPFRQHAAANNDPAGLPMTERVKRVEQQINNLQSSESSPRIDALQDQVRMLRGQIEQITHQLEQMQTQQKALLSDIDQRLAQQNAAASKINTTAVSGETPSNIMAGRPAGHKAAAGNKQLAKVAPANTGTAVKPGDNQPNVAEEQHIYQTAYNLIKAKKYNDAIAVLQNMLQKYPSGQFASNAHYWLGELYGLLGKNDQALTEFNTVVKSYPESPRLSDAQLKVGLIYAAQFKWSEAKSAFKRVINNYPGTTSAKLASEQLKQIKQAGH